MDKKLFSTLEACRSVMIDCKEILKTKKRRSTSKEILEACMTASHLATSALLIGSPKASYYCAACAEWCKMALQSLGKDYQEHFENCINACYSIDGKQYQAVA